ncbi:MAG: hypothetical protein CMK59_02490 [Proteobacteria bacterium]|nr:hypothetical protein [Pseudomonadota bacterium]
MLFLFLACSSSELPVCARVGGIAFREVPAGVFWMGEVGNEPYTVPLHTVAISKSFCMAEQEISQGLYQQIMQKNPSRHKGNRHPVENITWYEALAFANAWSLYEGLTPCYALGESQQDEKSRNVSEIAQCTGFRLPTEAEWEWTARNGRGGKVLKEPFDAERWEYLANELKQDQRAYAGGIDLERHVWHKNNSDGHHHPVRSKKSDSWGFFDMGGNVAEWVWDSFKEYPSTFQIDPKPSDIPHIRVSRGGGWSDSANMMRVAVRSGDGPEWSFDWVGFRLVKNRGQ